ncbi:FUSC family protein [Beijerinckia indica]|uniref:FUSC family protein n=1 Tax=Beijerinckia indica TaxID=533 RepID=UPI0002EF94A5|nr:FUSC family protein [Beijerinckia indica]
MPEGTWAEGTWAFVFRTWLAACLTLLSCFYLQLEYPATAVVSTIIIAQPVAGMALSKAMYRFVGTIVGAIVALLLTAAFAQDRTMLLAAFTLWIGICAGVGTILRDFRSYSAVLSGYTVAIISIAHIDEPLHVFDAAVARVSAISIAILSTAIVNEIFSRHHAWSNLLRAIKVNVATIKLQLSAVLDEQIAPTVEQRMALAAALMPLRSQLTYAGPELSDGPQRMAGARSVILALFDMISISFALTLGLRELPERRPFITQGISIARKALNRPYPEQLRLELTNLMRKQLEAGDLTLQEAFVLDRLDRLFEQYAFLRDGLRAMRLGHTPIRTAALPVHQDPMTVFLNALRVVLAVGLSCFLCVLSGWPGTSFAIVNTVSFIALGAVSDNPILTGRAALIGFPLGVLTAGLCFFFLLPAISGFPLLMVLIFPFVALSCLLIALGQSQIGMLSGVVFFLLTAPANPQIYDPQVFIDHAVLLVFGGVTIYASLWLALPVSLSRRLLRLAFAFADDLHHTLRGESGVSEEDKVSVQYDRWSQVHRYATARPMTLGRRNLLEQFSILGDLSILVRRAQVALARAPLTSEQRTQARAALTSLQIDPLIQAAQHLLSDAKGQRGLNSLMLLRAAASLYCITLLLKKGQPFLRHFKLHETRGHVSAPERTSLPPPPIAAISPTSAKLHPSYTNGHNQ